MSDNALTVLFECPLQAHGRPSLKNLAEAWNKQLQKEVEHTPSTKTDATAAILASLEEPKLTSLAEAAKKPPIEILPPGMPSLSASLAMKKKPPPISQTPDQQQQQQGNKPMLLEAPPAAAVAAAVATTEVPATTAETATKEAAVPTSEAASSPPKQGEESGTTEPGKDTEAPNSSSPSSSNPAPSVAQEESNNNTASTVSSGGPKEEEKVTGPASEPETKEIEVQKPPQQLSDMLGMEEFAATLQSSNGTNDTPAPASQSMATMQLADLFM